MILSFVWRTPCHSFLLLGTIALDCFGPFALLGSELGGWFGMVNGQHAWGKPGGGFVQTNVERWVNMVSEEDNIIVDLE